jgi:hypothetical protein
MDEKSLLDTKIAVGVLKEQVSTLTMLCNKMDVVIEKLVDQHDKHISKVYTDMEKRRLETDGDIREIHDRIDTVLDKVQSTELRLMDELKALRKDMMEHNNKEKETLDQILQWRWMIAGGIVVISWLVSHGTDIMKVLTKT